MMRIGFALALCIGLTLAAPASAQNLPSDYEEQLGIPPNSMNYDNRRGHYRNPPSDWEQKMQRRAYRDHGHYDYAPRSRYRSAYHHHYGYEPRRPFKGGYVHIYAGPW
jgi:hypothetical protein